MRAHHELPKPLQNARETSSLPPSVVGHLGDIATKSGVVNPADYQRLRAEASALRISVQYDDSMDGPVATH